VERLEDGNSCRRIIHHTKGVRLETVTGLGKLPDPDLSVSSPKGGGTELGKVTRRGLAREGALRSSSPQRQDVASQPEGGALTGLVADGGPTVSTEGSE
jgi:hypothetical protein